MLDPRSSQEMRRTAVGLAVVAMVVVAPFAVNDVLQGRLLHAAASIPILLVAARLAWSVRRRGSYSPALAFVLLVPTITYLLLVSVRDQGIIGVLWCYPACLAFFFVLPERMAWLANALLLGAVLPMAWIQLEPELAVRAIATTVMVSLSAAIFVRVITGQRDQLRELAVRDPLTGLFNRSLLIETLEDAVVQNDRSGAEMSLLLLDIDRFKAINDVHGHAAGDAALRRLARQMRSRLRRADRVFRLGGEEFLVLLFGTGAPEAERVAEELRKMAGQLELEGGARLTVSIGGATLRAREASQAWMKRADEKLYEAKEGGRDRVVF